MEQSVSQARQHAAKLRMAQMRTAVRITLTMGYSTAI